MQATENSEPTRDRFEPGQFESLEAASTPLVVVDSQSVILFANTAVNRLLGQRADVSFVGLTCHEILWGDDAPCDGCVVENQMEGLNFRTLSTVLGQRRFIREERLKFPGYDVLFLFDVTWEISALRKLEETFAGKSDVHS